MKYLYIDTNQYRHLYSKNEGFSEEIHSLVCKLIDNDHGRLLLPQQTEEEIHRNRMRAWPEGHKKSLDKQIQDVRIKADKVKGDYAEYDRSTNLALQIEKHATKLEKEAPKEIQHFTNDMSPPNKKLFDLLKRSERIPETDSIYTKAERRLAKGNPPYDSKIGDHLIWESIIERLATESKPELIFVGNDGNAWGKHEPDQWLVDEFKRRTSGRVVFIKRLSDIPGLTGAEQDKIKQAEERNSLENALSDFINSPSFTDAGKNARELLKYSNHLDEGDLLKIFDAARTNYEIYSSFFTAQPLKQLLGKDDFVRSSLEAIDPKTWADFEKKNNTGLKRQSDEESAALSELEAQADAWAEMQSDIERGH